MQTLKGASASTVAIHRAVEEALGGEVAQSSVRSYLRLNPNTFAQTSRGQYSLAAPMTATAVPLRLVVDEGRPMRVPHLGRPVFTFGQASLYQADCLDWLAAQEPNSLHACVTDPPYGLVEYTELEQAKLRARRGGVWRIPPSFDGHQRAPLPRFTTLTEADLEQLQRFFVEWGEAVRRVLVPGAHVVVAANPLVSHLVSVSLHQAGLERRGEIVRLVQTMRGGDRPKNAHDEFPDVSVMPRSQWEPWLLFRKVPQGRISDNLRKWKTGGLRRISDSQPFGDVIRSGPTRPTERRLANHPSLKPQEFLRKLVRAVLPLGEGVVLDPFAGSGSTLAAAEAVGYESVGVELDPDYVAVARKAIPSLARLKVGPAG
jgi:site-specific DNA-methyltransferase (adenine-specific)